MTEGTFTCPQCLDTYQPHWREPGSDVCRSCASDRNGFCSRAGHPHEGPCQGPRELAGDPCRYCARPIPGDGLPCPDCTVSLEGMPLADIKALFAGDDVLSVGGLGPAHGS